LQNLLLDVTRSHAKIALAVASCGLAALLLTDGTTAYWRFKVILLFFLLKTVDVAFCCVRFTWFFCYCSVTLRTNSIFRVTNLIFPCFGDVVFLVLFPSTIFIICIRWPARFIFLCMNCPSFLLLWNKNIVLNFFHWLDPN